jgi:mannosyltransferase
LRASLVAVLALVVLTLLGFATYPGERDVRAIGAKNGADYQSIASIIRDDQQPGDGLVIAANSRSLTAGTDYYLRHDPSRPPNLLTERSAAVAAQLAPVDYPDAEVHVQGTRRVWLLVSGFHNDPTWARTDLQTLLHKKYQRIALWHLKWSTLALYTLRT